MSDYTTKTYQMKREILSFSQKISKGCARDKQKFTADMIYGLLATKSCVLSEIAHELQEPIRKKNTIDRLSRQLAEGTEHKTILNYSRLVKKCLPEAPLVFVDDSDVIKPSGKKFEDLGVVRDGSSLDKKQEKGYHVTEVTALTRNSNHPISLFSKIHSSREKDYVSANEITFDALRKSSQIAGKNATFVFDRGYDMNKLFTFCYANELQFIIRLTSKRLLFYKGKWLKSTTLRDSRKGKIKTNVMFEGKKQPCYITCINSQITESRKRIKVLFVYGLGEAPMMLATNRDICCKDDAIRVVRAYLKRWRIEEYFRFKKQHFGFENFRVRSLTAMNALNDYLSYAIGFIALLSMKSKYNQLKANVLKEANALRLTVCFDYYRLAKGIAGLLKNAHAGIKDWFKPLRPKYRQLSFFD